MAAWPQGLAPSPAAAAEGKGGVGGGGGAASLAMSAPISLLLVPLPPRMSYHSALHQFPPKWAFLAAQ